MSVADLKTHASEHQVMLDELQMVRGNFNSFKDDHFLQGGSVLAPGWPVIMLLVGFTVGHLVTSDMGYCHDLKASRGEALATP